MTALNRTFAFAKVYGNLPGIQEAEKLALDGNGYYHALLGFLYAGSAIERAIAHYSKAIELTRSLSEKKTLAKEIEKLQSPN
jgi:RNA polymerase sigma-70 factor (ECF subfamily)